MNPIDETVVYLGSPMTCALFVLLTSAPLFATQPNAEPTIASAKITLKDVAIAELLEKLNIKLDYRLEGQVTIVASMSVEIGNATSSKGYTFRGQLTSAAMRFEGLQVRDLSANVLYCDGKLTLTELKGAVVSDDATNKRGEFKGMATADIEPRGDLKADLGLTNLPLGEVFKAMPGGVPVSGAVNGKIEFRSAVNDLRDQRKWTANANLDAEKLTIFQRSVRNAKLKLTLKDGNTTLTDVSAILEGIPVTGDATLAIIEKYAFRATFRTLPKDVSELQKLVPELSLPIAIRGKLTTDATIVGTLNPVAISASGSISASDLTTGDSPPGTLSAKWKVSPKRVNISELSALLFGGTFTGSADLPLTPDSKGDLNLSFTDVDATAIGKSFPKMPVRVTGQLSGLVKGVIPGVKGNEPRAIVADVNVTSDKLTVQGIPASKLTGKLSLVGDAIKYELEGKTLGGSFEINGLYPEQKAPKEENGSLRLRRIDLARLTEALRLRAVPLRGCVDLTFDYSPDFNNGSGRYSFRGLGWGRSRLISDIEGRIALRNGLFEASDAVGPIAGGTIRARVRASLENPSRNFFRLDIERADLGHLLKAFTDRPDLIEGGASLTIRGKFWPEFRATGSLGLNRGRVAGLMASDVRVPFTFITSAGGSQLVIRDANGMIGNGRVTAQLESDWGAGGHLRGQVRFSNVQIGNVFTELRQSNYFGNARITGRIDISGEDVLAAEDVTATLYADIAQASVRELPVLDRITPFVSPAAILKPFNSGEIRGRLSRGVFRIERLTLANSTADLYADGTVGLDGRLALAVIIRTGSIGVNDSVLRQTGLQLARLATPLPIQIIGQISSILSNRTVRLSVSGTISNPQTHVNAAALFTEETIRYFLRQSVFGTVLPLQPVTSPKAR